MTNRDAHQEMITKADADLAVAEALRKAGEAVETHFPGTLYASNRTKALAAILALANQDHLAEVQALKAERDRISAINVKHCETVNTLLIDGARLQERAEAAEAEVARLKNLLGRYSDHVGDAEGTDFLGDTCDGEFIAYPSDHLTEAECREIRSYSPHWAALTPKGDTP